MKRSLLSGLLGAGALLPGGLALASQSPDALIAAMDLDMSLVVSGSIATPNSSPQMFDVRTSLGVISPYNAPTMAVISTGNVDNITALEDYDYPGSGPDTSAGDYATLEFDIDVPEYAESFSFNFDFLSREYPEWVGSAHNHTFEVWLDSNAYQGQIVFDAFGNPVTVNNALFSETNPANLVGTGFDYDGSTGWVTTIAPCEGGETMHISFQIYDVADGVWDSAVLVDNFQFSEEEPPEDGPWTGDDTPDEPMEIAYVTPKEGDLGGGGTVTIHGDGFSPDGLSIYWGDVLLASDTWTVGTGGEAIVVDDVPGATAEGNIDVRLVRGLEEVTLNNGYAYWDYGGGNMPPRIDSVYPGEANPSGGTTITVRGQGFTENVTVQFVDDEGNVAEGQDPVANEVDGGGLEVIVNTPPHDEGFTMLVVVNSDGLPTDPGYPFLFTEAAAEPDDGGGAGGAGGSSCATGRSGRSSIAGDDGSAAALLLLGILMLARGLALRVREV
jgi:hypothetical protein